MTLSGGVDSLFTLRRNRLWYAQAHPCRIRPAILGEGFEVRRQGQCIDEIDLVPALCRLEQDELAGAVESNIGEFQSWRAWRDGTRRRHRVARALHLRH